MRKTFGILAIAALTMAGVQPVLAQDSKPDADTVVATVNGTAITLGHMILARASLPEQFRQLPADMLFPGILDQLIQQTALAQSFEGDLSRRAAMVLENERRSITAAEAADKVLRKAATEEAVRQAYDETFATAEAETEYNASHILVESEQEAEAIVKEIRRGADFALTAKRRSTGPSGPNGGELGWFGVGRMVPEFEAVVLTLQPGQVSQPVETQFGWHVIKLNETRQRDIPEFDDVRIEMENKVRQQSLEAEINRLTAAAKIERLDQGIDANLLDQPELLE